MFKVMKLASRINILAVLLGFYLLFYLRRKYKQEYYHNKWSIFSFVFIEIFANLFIDFSSLVEFWKKENEMKTINHICIFNEFSMFKMWFLAIAIIFYKKTNEPLSGFLTVEFLNLVSEN
jgi:hypothetical protein